MSDKFFTIELFSGAFSQENQKRAFMAQYVMENSYKLRSNHKDDAKVDMQDILKDAQKAWNVIVENTPL